MGNWITTADMMRQGAASEKLCWRKPHGLLIKHGLENAPLSLMIFPINLHLV